MKVWYNRTMGMPEMTISAARIDEESFEGTAGTIIELSEGAEIIGDRAFASCNNLAEIFIPESVTELGDDLFQGVNDVTIFGYADSKAETYAFENGYDFVPVNG